MIIHHKKLILGNENMRTAYKTINICRYDGNKICEFIN